MKFKQENTGVVIYNPENVTSAPELEVGKEYPVYNDGKISFTRLNLYEIKEKLDLDNDNIEPEVLEEISSAVSHTYWLYNENQSTVYVADDGCSYIYFLRTKSGGWFSTGLFSGGELDFDGKLGRSLLKNHEIKTEEELKKYVDEYLYICNSDDGSENKCFTYLKECLHKI